MEWQGINVSNYHEQKWVTQSIRSLLFSGLTIMTVSLISILIFWETKTLSEIEYKNRSNITQLNQEQQQLEQQIQGLRNQHSPVHSSYLAKHDIRQFIDYLTQLPVTGFIEHLQLYIDLEVKLKIVGKLSDEHVLETLITQLKQDNYDYKIEHIEKNEQHQLEFNLIITLSKQNETLD